MSCDMAAASVIYTSCDDTDELRFATTPLVFGRTRAGLPFAALGFTSSSADVFAFFSPAAEDGGLDDFCRRRVTPLLVAGRAVDLASETDAAGAGEEELPRTGLRCAASMHAPPG